MQETPLHIASRFVEGGEKCALLLLKSGANTNMARSDGVTPLHVAASEGNADIIRLLLVDGANALLQNQVFFLRIRIVLSKLPC